MLTVFIVILILDVIGLAFDYWLMKTKRKMITTYCREHVWAAIALVSLQVGLPISLWLHFLGY